LVLDRELLPAEMSHVAVLDATELYRFYHSGDTEIVAVRGVSLSLDKGELVALVGPSGSGKSTLLHLLAGLDEPDGGQVSIAGLRLTRRPENVRTAIRARGIGVFMQSGNLIDHLTVADNIRLQRSLARQRVGATSITKLATQFGLSAHWNALPAELSGGEIARAGLAVALAAEPSVLLCDEPTAEVDAETERRIISDLAERKCAGVAILVATHSSALARAADRVLHLQDGRLVDG
jgi:putative ABC transport system ATP-binding protein